MGSYMAFHHHLPEDSTEGVQDTVTHDALTPAERLEIDGQ